ncbi:MAG: lysophospholipase [Deltaproteobacteria bacterium]|nr:lysophospholipase [Deltaproteobacteria bacterium]
MTTATRFAAAESGHFNAADGVQIQYRVHQVDAPRFGVVVVHGFAEHGNRYGHLVDAVVPAGGAVLTYDQRGHGQSGGRRVFVLRFDEYLDDLAQVLALAKSKLPQPLFVVGHSMGGLVVLSYALRDRGAAAAWAVSNPALVNRVAVPAWKEALAKAMSSLVPALSLPSGIPPDHISRDADEVRQYADDPLNSKNATARWYTEYVAAQQRLAASAEGLRDLPLLVQIGDGDRIIDPGVTRKFCERIGGSALRVEVYPGLYHEIFNELTADRDRVLADLVGWLTARAA